MGLNVQTSDPVIVELAWNLLWETSEILSAMNGVSEVTNAATLILLISPNESYVSCSDLGRTCLKCLS